MKISDHEQVVRRLREGYTRRLRPKEAAGEAEVSEKTARRYFKVFELIDSGQDALTIQSMVNDWSVEHVRFVIRGIKDHAKGDEQKIGGPTQVDPEYVHRHRRELSASIGHLRQWSQQRVWPSIRPILEGSWPHPFNGNVRGVSGLPGDADPLLECVVRHLDKLRLGQQLDAVRNAAETYRDAVFELWQEVRHARSTDSLPEEIEVDMIDMGLGQVRKPSTELLDFMVKETDGRFEVRGGAYSHTYGSLEDAEDAAVWANRIAHTVGESRVAKRVVQLFDALNSAIEAVKTLLEDADLVYRAVTHSTCDRCGLHAPLTGSSMTSIV